MKIRGTPAHIAEKYLSLARDAQSSGDPVLAENYLQHAEHYSRIIMAYRDQLQQPGDVNGNGQRLQQGDLDEYGEDEGDDMLDDGFQPLLHSHPQPQPVHSRPYESNRHENNRHENNRHEGGRLDGPHRHDRPFRRDHGRFRDRNIERERPMESRPQPPSERSHEPVAESGGERRREKFQPSHEQPDFLRRPVRRARSESEVPLTAPSKDEPSRD